MSFKCLITAAALATLLGASPSPAQSPAQSLDPALRAKLPKSTLDSGVITAGTDPHKPPYSFYGPDNTTLIGLEHDLVAIMEKKLGVRFQFSTGQFASITTGVQADRFDMGISSIGDFIEREKIVDEIDYTYEGTGIIVPKGNPDKIGRISDLCGLKAAGVLGSTPLALLEKQATLCPKNKPLEVLQFPGDDQSFLAVRSGRADALMTGYGLGGYTIEHQPESGGRPLELIKATKYAVGYQAMIVGKDKPQLRDAIQATLQSMIDDGSYAAVFRKWGLERNMLETVTVNDAARFVDYMKLD